MDRKALLDWGTLAFYIIGLVIMYYAYVEARDLKELVESNDVMAICGNLFKYTDSYGRPITNISNFTVPAGVEGFGVGSWLPKGPIVPLNRT